MTFPFTRDRYRHTLLARTGPVCLVARVSTHQMSDGATHWEVVWLQAHAAWTTPDGKPMPAGEHYPSSSQWGTHGWTYTTEAEATARYQAEAAQVPAS